MAFPLVSRSVMHQFCSALFVALASAASLPAFALTLEQAETQLLQKNHDVLAARRAYETAVSGITVAGQAPNPTLTYSTSKVDTRSGIGSGPLRDKKMDQTLMLQQQIERGNRRELRTSSAEAQAKAAQADYADVRRQQRLALYQAWFDLLAAQERDRLLNETASLYKRSLDATNLRLKVGDISRVEASRLRVEALRAQNDARSAHADFEKAQRQLALVIGVEDKDELVPEVVWPAVTKPGPVPPLDNRPDVVAALARIDAADKNRSIARSLTTRDVVVGAQVEREPPTPAVTYGLTVSIPLFVRYAYEGEKAQAETQYTAALESREKVLHEAETDAKRARVDMESAAEKLVRIEEDALPQAREVGTASEFAYNKGALGLTDLLDARRTLRAVELEAVAARADYAKARAAWLAATEWERSE